MKRKILLIDIILLCFIIIACGRAKKEFEKAKQENTIQAYEEFIQRHPKSSFVEEATEILDSLRFEIVSSKDSIEVYKKFAEKYPDSRFIGIVNERIEELHFNEAISNNSVGGFKEFLEKYPKSSYAPKAEERLKQLQEEKTYKYFHLRVSEVAQSFPHTVVYLNVSPVASKLPNTTKIPCIVSMNKVFAHTKQGGTIPMDGIAISGKIAFALPSVTIRRGDSTKRLNFDISSGELVQLLAPLPRAVK